MCGCEEENWPSTTLSLISGDGSGGVDSDIPLMFLEEIKRMIFDHMDSLCNII